VIVLDTDHTTLFQQSTSESGRSLREKLLNCEDRDICVTVVSLEEQMRGWLAAIRKQNDVSQQVVYYDRLIDVVHFFNPWRILRFDEAAAETFAALRVQRVRTGSQDLKIASICLVNEATLLTGNTRDFETVPGLTVEDWIH